MGGKGVVVVTGATGRQGSAVAGALLAHGWRLWARGPHVGFGYRAPLTVLPAVRTAP